jgi:hypothetical protein
VRGAIARGTGPRAGPDDGVKPDRGVRSRLTAYSRIAGRGWPWPRHGRGADPHPAGEQAVPAPGVQVGEKDGDGLAHQPATVGHEAEPTKHKPGVLQVEELASGQVDGYLVVVLFPARRLTFTGDGWLRRDGAQQLRDPGNTYPA